MEGIGPFFFSVRLGNIERRELPFRLRHFNGFYWTRFPEKRHFKVHHALAVPRRFQFSRVCEMPKLAMPHFIAIQNLSRLRTFFWRNRQQHSLLRFGKENLPGRQALVLQRDGIKVQRHAGLCAHFARRAGNAARAEVGNGANAIRVAQGRDRRSKSPLSDRMPDLHGGGFALQGITRHSSGAHRGAVNAVAASIASNQQRHVTRSRRIFQRIFSWDQSEGMSERQALGITRMNPIDRMHHRNPHGVGVIPCSTNRFRDNQLRVQGAARDGVLCHSRVHGAHDGRAANRVSALAKSQRVANHSAMLGGHAAKRSDGAGEIVGLAFDRHHPAIVKLDAARIVLEDRDHQRMSNSFRRLGQPLEQSETFPRGVIAMVAPRLRQDFNFRVRVRPPACRFVRLDHAHLRERRVPRPRARQGHELIVA